MQAQLLPPLMNLSRARRRPDAVGMQADDGASSEASTYNPSLPQNYMLFGQEGDTYEAALTLQAWQQMVARNRTSPVVRYYLENGAIPVPTENSKHGWFGIAPTSGYGIETRHRIKDADVFEQTLMEGNIMEARDATGYFMLFPYEDMEAEQGGYVYNMHFRIRLGKSAVKGCLSGATNVMLRTMQLYDAAPITTNNINVPNLTHEDFMRATAIAFALMPEIDVICDTSHAVSADRKWPVFYSIYTSALTALPMHSERLKVLPTGQQRPNGAGGASVRPLTEEEGWDEDAIGITPWRLHMMRPLSELVMPWIIYLKPNLTNPNSTMGLLVRSHVEYAESIGHSKLLLKTTDERVYRALPGGDDAFYTHRAF